MTEQKDAENLEAELFAAIDECKQLWLEIGRLDDDDRGVASATEKTIRLQRKIVRMSAMTAEGYHANIETIPQGRFQ